MMWLRTFASLLGALIYGWIVALDQLLALLLRLCRKWHRHEEHPDTGGTCFPVHHPSFLRPEPLLSSQRALMAQGLAVTQIEPKVEGYRTAYRSLTGMDIGQAGTPSIEQQV